MFACKIIEDMRFGKKLEAVTWLDNKGLSFTGHWVLTAAACGCGRLLPSPGLAYERVLKDGAKALRLPLRSKLALAYEDLQQALFSCLVLRLP